MKPHPARRAMLIGAMLLAAASLVAPLQSEAQALKAGRLRVALLADPVNFDPAQFSSQNFPLIKNLYDSLIEYTPEGQAIPSLASATSRKDFASPAISSHDDYSHSDLNRRTRLVETAMGCSRWSLIS